MLADLNTANNLECAVLLSRVTNLSLLQSLVRYMTRCLLCLHCGSSGPGVWVWCASPGEYVRWEFVH